MKCTCKQCGKEFEISPAEISFYKRKKLRLPKRCKECRQKNKENNEKKINENTETAEKSYKNFENKTNEAKYESHSVNNNENNSGNKKSFTKRLVPIVTAVVVAIAAIFGINIVNDDSGTDADSSGANVTAYETNVSETGRSSIEEDFGRHFKNAELLNDHYIKHGKEMGFSSAEKYEEAAAAVVHNKKALNKKEAEDNDDVFYIEDTNEFVIVSTDGYIRTYFNPDDGIEYYNRQ